MPCIPCILLSLTIGLLGIVSAYEQPRPDYIDVEVTFYDHKLKDDRTEKGQLWFTDIPRFDRHGRVRGFGRRACLDGIKWFVPIQAGDIWLAKDPNEPSENTFILKDYIEEAPVQLAITRIDVVRTDDGKMADVLKTKGRDLLRGADTRGVNEDLAGLTMDGEAVSEIGEEDLATMKTQEKSIAQRGSTAVAKKDDDKPSKVKFATKEPIGIDRIYIADLKKIVFLKAAGGMKRESYTGRFVQYSKQATGDNGTVGIAAATYFGGKASEKFMYGAFMADDSIMMSTNVHDLSFCKQDLIHVIGTDPAADAYPAKEVTDRKKRTRMEYPRTTASFVHYSADLQNIIKIIRLPWGVGKVHTINAGPDESMYISGWVGPHFDRYAKEQGLSATIAHPEAVEASKKPDKRGRTKKLREDGFIAKLNPGLKTLAWLIRVKHDHANIFLRPDGKLLIQRRNKLFFAMQDGSVTEGPQLDIVGSNLSVDPRTGDMYFSGSFRSATGLEPWVSPYIWKVGADGKIKWSAYSWSGPIVGVQQHRLVSDSSVQRVTVNDNGTLTFNGWSDGGNTVFIKQPYDMRQMVPSQGFCSSTWGALGGLTVRIANIVQMDANTMEASSRTQYVNYIPSSDLPTLLNIYDIKTLPNGDVAVTGGGWNGFVETHDAWIRPWYLEYRENRHAQSKSGTFFTVFRKGFGPPRMATRVPMTGNKLAMKGNKLLLFGATGGSKDGRPRTRFDMGEPTLIHKAVQDVCGGGLDAYVMLIDTQAEPKPVVYPEWGWNSPDKIRAEKKEAAAKKRKAAVNIR